MEADVQSSCWFMQESRTPLHCLVMSPSAKKSALLYLLSCSPEAASSIDSVRLFFVFGMAVSMEVVSVWEFVLMFSLGRAQRSPLGLRAPAGGCGHS